MTEKLYYITWDEYKDRMHTARVKCVYGTSIKQVREEFVQPEQDERRRSKRPHMFHVEVSIRRPADTERRMKGHFYY